MTNPPNINVELEFVGGALDGGKLRIAVPSVGVGIMRFPIHEGILDQRTSSSELVYASIGSGYRWESYVIGHDPEGKWFGVEKHLYEKLLGGI